MTGQPGQPKHRRHTKPRTAARPGFTLIELLVVLGIIGLLIGITLVVGAQVMNSGRQRVTQDAIRVLDTALSAYETAVGGNPPPTTEDPRVPLAPAGQLRPLLPVADALDVDDNDPGDTPPTHRMINSVGLFYAQAAMVPSAKAVLDTLPGKLVRTYDAYSKTWRNSNALKGAPALTTVMDGWGEPIRYVHPMFHGTITGDLATANPQPTASRDLHDVIGAALPTGSAITKIRRNHTILAEPNPAVAENWPDSDGGTCTSNRPYFYSTGPDKHAGYIVDAAGKPTKDYNKDNVYTTQPTMPFR